MSEIFEKAAREKIRFNTSRGVLSIEDVYQLPVESPATGNQPRIDLKTIRIDLEKEKSPNLSDSFFSKKSKIDETLELKIALIEHIAAIKIAEAEAAAKEKENKSLEQKLIGFLEEQQDASLRSLSPDELKAKIASLRK